jgi:hypothetical protein
MRIQTAIRAPIAERALAGVVLWACTTLAAGAHAQATSGTLLVGPGQTLVIGPGVERHHTGPIIVSGGRIEVNGGKLFLNGSLIVVQNGAVVFDAGELHHEGEDTHVLLGGVQQGAGDGVLAFRNGGRYHFVQSYVSQHELRARGASRIELDGTEIDCDAGTIPIRLFDTASYAATGTHTRSGSWVTWYLQQSARLSLKGVVNAGDIVFYDAARIDVRDTIGVMPWLYFPAGSVADLSFPAAAQCEPGNCPLVSKTIDAGSVHGIDWSVRIENSGLVLWGINSYPGSDVTVRDSALAMAMVRLAADHTYVVNGEFHNGSSYDYKTFASLPDRVLRMIGTSVQWWKVDVIEQAQARIDDISFAEMMVKNSGRALVTRSICEGQTIHLGATDDADLYFQDGEVWTHVSVWDRALLVLERSLVDWRKGQYQYQTRNIAHDRARLYALDSELVSPPEAMDAALVTFARLGTFAQAQLETTASKWTAVAGDAWIATGPGSSVLFDRWTLAIRAAGASGWTTFATGTTEVRDATLAWLRPGLISQPGEYQLKLTLFVRGDEPLTPHPTWAFPAVKTLVVR